MAEATLTVLTYYEHRHLFETIDYSAARIDRLLQKVIPITIEQFCVCVICQASVCIDVYSA